MAKGLREAWGSSEAEPELDEKKRRITGLHILLTYRCIFECDHCFVWSSPDSQGTMTLSFIKRILEEAEEAGINQIYFEGGEAFLYYPILVKAVEEAVDKNFWVGLTANCYWATSKEDALLWLAPFKGISRLELSGDPYHGKVEDTRYGVAAARELGIPVSIISIGPPSGPKEIEGVKVGYYDLMCKGRAVELAPDLDKIPVEELNRCPSEDFNDPGRVHIDPYGWVFMCQGITIGNINEKRLSDILKDYDPHHHSIIAPLMEGGPIKLVKRYSLPHEETYADACELCYRSRLLLREEFPDILAPDQVYGISSN